MTERYKVITAPNSRHSNLFFPVNVCGSNKSKSDKKKKNKLCTQMNYSVTLGMTVVSLDFPVPPDLPLSSLNHD